MTTITWPTVAALGLVFGLIGWLAYLDHGVAAAVAGAIGATVTAFLPAIVQREVVQGTTRRCWGQIRIRSNDAQPL